MLPVHNHSEYSALDGRSTVEEIAFRIDELGLPGAFLTDHGTVAGLWHFEKAMRDKGLFCGFGLEAYQSFGSRHERQMKPGDWRLKGKEIEKPRAFKKGEDSFHLVLLAKSNEGYRNLLRISDEGYRTGFYYDPRIDKDVLNAYKEGLVCTTACMGSLANKRLMKCDDPSAIYELAKIFKDDFFIELHTYDTPECHELNKRLAAIANDSGYPVIYANDAHYTHPGEFEIHEAMLCAQMGGKFFDDKGDYNNHPTENFYRHPKCMYIMDESDVRAHLDHLPKSVVDEAIANSDLLMERCQVQLEKPGTFLPKFIVEKDDPADRLFDLVEEGIILKYGEGDSTDIPREVWERAQYEYDAIVGAGLQDYFLIVWDFCKWADDQGILRGPGRGSAGGSLLSHALDITHIDPLKHNLQFERFWNPGRADGLPDIDIDFEKKRIEEVRQYVRNKYGEDKVIRIGNHMRMGPKSAIDKAGMVLFAEPPYGAMKVIKDIIETTVDAGQSPGWKEMWEMLGEWADQEGKDHPLEHWAKEFPDMFSLAEELSGRISGYGIHASAVVISSVPIDSRLPARSSAEEGATDRQICTQAEMKQVEKEGFPKFDFLALKNLDTIKLAALLSGDFGEDSRETHKKIARHFRFDVNYDHLADGYYEQIDKKQTLGLFQIEEGTSARSIGAKIKPRNLEELALIVALNRPGPLRSKDDSGRNMVERFTARRNGDEDAVYPHELLDEILSTTYGDFLYQEQVIAYFRALGYDLSDADHIRKILGKKLVEEMKAELPKYLEKAERFMPRALAEIIWGMIEAFSKYSFNKAHAIGYATILAWTMYAKRKWPVEFIMASIIISPKRVAEFVKEARRIGVKVLPPDAKVAEVTISKAEEGIMYGLQDIKGVGAPASRWIVQNRKKFNEVEDVIRLIDETDKCPCNRGHFKTFLKAGAFDSFGYRLEPCRACSDGKVRRMVPTKKDPEKLIGRWFDCDDCVLGFTRVEIPADDEIFSAQEEYLGLILDQPHSALIKKYAKEFAALDSYSEAENDSDEKKKIRVPGVITEVTKIVVKQGKYNAGRTYAAVKIEWKGEEIEFKAWPDEYDNNKDMLKPRVLGRFNLEVNKKGASLKGKGKRYID